MVLETLATKKKKKKKAFWSHRPHFCTSTTETVVESLHHIKLQHFSHVVKLQGAQHTVVKRHGGQMCLTIKQRMMSCPVKIASTAGWCIRGVEWIHMSFLRSDLTLMFSPERENNYEADCLYGDWSNAANNVYKILKFRWSKGLNGAWTLNLRSVERWPSDRTCKTYFRWVLIRRWAPSLQEEPIKSRATPRDQLRRRLVAAEWCCLFLPTIKKTPFQVDGSWFLSGHHRTLQLSLLLLIPFSLPHHYTLTQFLSSTAAIFLCHNSSPASKHHHFALILTDCFFGIWLQR